MNDKEIDRFRNRRQSLNTYISLSFITEDDDSTWSTQSEEKRKRTEYKKVNFQNESRLKKSFLKSHTVKLIIDMQTFKHCRERRRKKIRIKISVGLKKEKVSEEMRLRQCKNLLQTRLVHHLWLLSDSDITCFVDSLINIHSALEWKDILNHTHASSWIISQLMICKYFKRRVEHFAIQSEYLLTKFVIKSFLTICVNLTRRMLQRCWTYFAWRDACIWISNITFQRWYLDLLCLKIFIQKQNHRALIQSILLSVCMKDIALKRRESFSQKMRTNDELWIFILRMKELALARRYVRWQVSDFSFKMKNVLREHNAKFSKFYDEDTFRQICIFTLRDDIARRRRWFIRLSQSMRRCVLRLKTFSKKFVKSLNALILFADLWLALLIETFTQLLNLRCFKI